VVSATTLSPTAAEISEILAQLQDDFGWPERADRFDLVETWDRPRSGSLFYRMKGATEGHDLVVKLVPGWSHGNARRAYRAMADLDEVIASARLENARGVRPLAWHDDPPLVVMPYVESLDLVSIIRRPAHPAWESGDLERWMIEAGTILATFHHTPPAGWRPNLAEADEEARRVARRLWVSETEVDRLLAEVRHDGRAKRRYGDYGPGNFQGAEDGSLYLLDPPFDDPTSLIHRDISNFLFETRRQLAGRGFTPSPPVRGWFHDFRERLLHGYARAAPGFELGPADEALLALFDMKRAVAMSRKRFPRRAMDAAWFARLALRRRRDLRRALRALGPTQPW
jgi:hypothetical protein